MFTLYPLSRIGVSGRDFRFYSDRVSCYIRRDAFAKKLGVQHELLIAYAGHSRERRELGILAGDERSLIRMP